MKRRQREAVVAALDNKLREHHSWCGETHLQKSLYFLQEMMGVPTEFSYVLYKFGPYSRELKRELAVMQSDGFIEVVPQQAPYGPSLLTTDNAERQLIGRFPKTLARHEARLDFVAQRLGGRGVGSLERLATALWVKREMPEASRGEQAEKINEVKPHVSIEQATEALRDVEDMEAEAEELGE